MADLDFVETDATSCDDDRSLQDLRSVYRMPAQGAIDKVRGQVSAAAAGFIENAPLMVIASTDGTSVDASPRGGLPGFVKVIDPHTLAFGDLTGNNRLDTYTNVQSIAAVGLIFLVPGAEETLRVNGRASVTTDDELRRRCADGGRIPKVVVTIRVDECYLHCGAALRRAALWDVSTWPATESRPSAGEILKEAIDTPVSAADIDANLAKYYDHGVWEVGGAEPPAG